MKKMKKSSSGELIFGLIVIFVLIGGVLNKGQQVAFTPTADSKLNVVLGKFVSSAITIKNSPLYLDSEKTKIIANLKPNEKYKVLEATRYESNNKIKMVKVKVGTQFGWLSTQDVRLESKEVEKQLLNNKN